MNVSALLVSLIAWRRTRPTPLPPLTTYIRCTYKYVWNFFYVLRAWEGATEQKMWASTSTTSSTLAVNPGNITSVSQISLIKESWHRSLIFFYPTRDLSLNCLGIGHSALSLCPNANKNLQNLSNVFESIPKFLFPLANWVRLGSLDPPSLTERLNVSFQFVLSNVKKKICLNRSHTPNHGILTLFSRSYYEATSDDPPSFPELSRKLVTLLLAPTLLEIYEFLQICLNRFRNVFYHRATK